jgi:hypothetical protein
MPNGQIRVHAGLWEREGGNIEEILDRSSPGRSGPTEFESAKTLPAGGGAGSTMGGSIAPGVGKKR